MLTKEDIILLFLEDPLKLETEIFKENVPKSDEIRTLICELGNPWCAYRHARNIDKGPTNETRTVTCKDPGYAYWYARDVDQNPHPETREACCKKPWEAYQYAVSVDKRPTKETRQAAYKDKEVKDWYEQWENSLKKI